MWFNFTVKPRPVGATHNLNLQVLIINTSMCISHSHVYNTRVGYI